MHILIITPVYEDWACAAMLCAAIDQCLGKAPEWGVSILLVDDGSSKGPPQEFPAFVPSTLQSIRVLTLRRNLGHQRAIAVALAYVQRSTTADAVIVMDADGEDRPEDIPRLIGAFQASSEPVAVFAERGRRIESISFKLYYLCYRLMHRVLTGRNIRFGNFSLLPRHHLERLVAYPELWNHYAAAVLRSRLPFTTLRANRGQRFIGKSKMGFVSLVIHGLSALFASYEVVSTRMLVATLLLAALLLVMLIFVFALKLIGHMEIPGWASLASGVLLLLISQAFATALTIIFSVMMSRNNLGFIPVRDYEYFVADCVEIGSK